MIGDAKALRASLKPMLADSEFGAIPVDRFPRYLLVSRGRLQEINQLLKAHYLCCLKTVFDILRRGSNGVFNGLVVSSRRSKSAE